MLTRIITAVLGIPLVILVILLGNIWLKLVIAAISCIALYEIYHVMREKYTPIKWLGYTTIGLYYLLFEWIQKDFLVFISLVVILLLTVMVIKYPKYSIVDVALTLFPVLYTGLLFSFIILIRGIEHGMFWVWLIPISAWGSDTFAYFTGITLGKHKLAPHLSPKKTIEGSIGGVLGAGVIGYIYTVTYTLYSATEISSYSLLVVIAVMLSAILSQIGDLAASAIKRYFKEKDFGYLLPGHGGILDRFDSLLFVAPAIYVAILAAENIMR